MNMELDLEDLVVNGEGVGKKERRRIVQALTGMPWAIYLKRGRFFAKRYRDREGCVSLAISKALARQVANTFNEELLEIRAMVREARAARRQK